MFVQLVVVDAIRSSFGELEPHHVEIRHMASMDFSLAFKLQASRFAHLFGSRILPAFLHCGVEWRAQALYRVYVTRNTVQYPIRRHWFQARGWFGLIQCPSLCYYTCPCRLALPTFVILQYVVSFEFRLGHMYEVRFRWIVTSRIKESYK